MSVLYPPRRHGSGLALAGYVATYLSVLFVLIVLRVDVLSRQPSLEQAPHHVAHLGLGESVFLALSSAVVTILLLPLQTALVRLLKGQWPPNSPITRRIISYQRRRMMRLRARRQELANAIMRAREGASSENRDVHTLVLALAAVEKQMSRLPLSQDRLTPTTLGNVLAASEDSIWRIYGLELAVTWPRLYPQLDPLLRASVDRQRNLLDAWARATVAFGAAVVALVVLLALGPGVWWFLIMVPLLATADAYLYTLRAADGYGVLLRVSFDMHRFDLLRALHLQLPSDPQAERKLNMEVSRYLSGGSESGLEYQHDDIDVTAKRFEEAVHAAFVPPPLVSFSGAVGVTLTNARTADDADGRRVWRIPRNKVCLLTVVVQTGPNAMETGPAALSTRPGLQAWEPLDVRGGRQAGVVEMDLVLDAPFLEVTKARGKFTCPTTGGEDAFESELRATQTGPYDLRVVLLSAGRLIQAVPVEIVVVENS